MPDIRKPDGLLDIIALGCVLEFTTALSRARYNKNYDASTDEECAVRMQENQARTWFRVLMKVFATKYYVLTSNNFVHASYVWHSVMVGFAAAVVTHMKEKKNIVKMSPGVTPTAVENALRLHLAEDHPHLVAAFDAALRGMPQTMLTWPSGVAFEVIPKSPSCDHLLRALGIQEERVVPGTGLALHAPDVNTAGENVASRYYRGVWPGEDLPHDNF